MKLPYSLGDIDMDFFGYELKKKNKERECGGIADNTNDLHDSDLQEQIVRWFEAHGYNINFRNSPEDDPTLMFEKDGSYLTCDIDNGFPVKPDLAEELWESYCRLGDYGCDGKWL